MENVLSLKEKISETGEIKQFKEKAVWNETKIIVVNDGHRALLAQKNTMDTGCIQK